MAEPRKRRPNARRSEIIIGGIMEHLAMLDSASHEAVKTHTARLRELFEELTRAMNSKEGTDE